MRCLAGGLLAIWAGACNPVFGIPEIHEGNIDECVTGIAACSPDATCTDTPDSYSCACKSGFTGDGKTCTDINECAVQSPCAAHASCSNTPGSFTCTCDQNFAGDGTTYCAPSTFKQVAVAGGFACGIGGDGAMYCWGSNTLGQLGDGTFVPHARPQPVGTATDWIAVGARLLKACGLRSDHSLWCWGSGATNGALGDGKQLVEPSPALVVSDKPGVGWKAFGVGRNRVCGIHDDGSLACWGTDPISGAIVNKPAAIGTDQDWTQISVGAVACGLRNTTGGNLFCFGKSSVGDLGLGTITSQALPARVGTATWNSVAVGYFNACGVQANGALFCWGNNPSPSSPLQYGTSPTQIGTATDWSSITLSIATIAGLRAGGAAYLWGDNSLGAAGIAQLGEIAQPTAISGTVTGWTSVVAGNSSGCGIAAGKAYCWGFEADGSLGDGSPADLYAPTRTGSDRWLSVVTGIFSTCGVRSDQAALCWGFDLNAGVGLGNTDPAPAPTRLDAASWTAITATNQDTGLATFCGIRGGTLVCWGNNSTGAVGIGNTTTPQLTPVPVSVTGAIPWTEVSSSTHACAIRSGQLYCWGANGNGQLGNNTPGPTPVTAPATLSGTWLHVEVAGFAFGASGPGGLTYGIKDDHTLWSWGVDLSGAEHDVPTQVGTDTDWATVSVSEQTACAVKTGGALFCRGTFIGDGTNQAVTTMTRVGTASDWKSVSCGNEVCAVKTDGSLWCWGNAFGDPLGNGSAGVADPITQAVPTTLSPTRIGNDTDWASVSARGGSSCAIKSDGSLWCWGARASITPQVKTTPVLID